VSEGADPTPPTARRWNPWRALRAAASVDLWFVPLGDDRGRWVRTSTGDEIHLDPALDRRTRNEVLAHELVHAERGVGFPAASVETMQLEEERVWRIALERLAPAAEIEAFARRRATVGPVLVADLAEEFDLSPEAAARVARLVALRRGLEPPEEDPADRSSG
jgi:hypothetical protein